MSVLRWREARKRRRTIRRKAKEFELPKFAIREAEKAEVPLTLALAVAEHERPYDSEKLRARLADLENEQDKYLRAYQAAWFCRLRAVLPDYED